MHTLPDYKPTTLAYLPLAKVRTLDTETLRQIQLWLGDYIETYPHFSREYRRLQGACAKVLSERHRDPQLSLNFITRERHPR